MRKQILATAMVLTAGAGLGVAAPVASASPASPAVLESDPNIFVALSKKIIPSVVNISTLNKPERVYGPDEFFMQFFGNGGFAGPVPSHPTVRRTGALGTGFLIGKDGTILTNNHVVADADQIKISFTESPDEKPIDAKVIGRDPELDVALIQVKTSRKLTPLELGDSEALQVGEYVAAVGNPFGRGHSLTHGIISAKGRPAPDFPLATYLQTDAPINPGNSGGPLVNLRGQVIGINSAIDARAQGIGFAIPINSVKAELDQLKENGKVSRGYLGVLIENLNPDLAEKLKVDRDRGAALVSHVYDESPAAKAGIKPYDVVLAVNGQPVHSSSEMMTKIVAVPAGEKAKLTLARDGKTQVVTVKLTQRPSSKDFARMQRGLDDGGADSNGG